MRKGIIVFLVVSVIGYFLSLPYLTLYELNRSCEIGDSRAIRKMVDFQALSQNLKDQIRPIVKKKMAEDLRDNPFAMLAQSFLDSILDRVIESLLLNDEPCFVHGPTQFAKGTILGFASLDTFAIDAKKNEHVITLIFERQGLSWRLCNVIAPFDKIMYGVADVNTQKNVVGLIKPTIKQTKDNVGETSAKKNQDLMQAALRGDLEEVKRLLNVGSDINTKDNNGLTILMGAAALGHIEVAKVLLDKGADTKVTNKDGKTALIFAAEKGHIEIVKLLIAKGADINAKDISSRTALMSASKADRVAVVKLLIDKGTDVNAKDNFGRTALMAASWEGHLEVVKLLLDEGADVNAIDKNGYTVLRMATTNGGPEVVTVLKDHGAKK